MGEIGTLSEEEYGNPLFSWSTCCVLLILYKDAEKHNMASISTWND
jgi:hypothetical protein